MLATRTPTFFSRMLDCGTSAELRQSLPSQIQANPAAIDQICTRDGQVSITVQDQGQGFDSETVPDPTTPENSLIESGRGIHLMKALMDAVRFDAIGTVVHMLKRSNAHSALVGVAK